MISKNIDMMMFSIYIVWQKTIFKSDIKKNLSCSQRWYFRIAKNAENAKNAKNCFFKVIPVKCSLPRNVDIYGDMG